MSLVGKGYEVHVSDPIMSLVSRAIRKGRAFFLYCMVRARLMSHAASILSH